MGEPFSDITMTTLPPRLGRFKGLPRLSASLLGEFAAPAEAQAVGIESVAYIVEKFPRPWVTAVFAYRGEDVTLIDDFPLPWQEAAAAEIVILGMTDGDGIINASAGALGWMIRMSHPLGGIRQHGLTASTTHPMTVPMLSHALLTASYRACRGTSPLPRTMPEA